MSDAVADPLGPEPGPEMVGGSAFRTDLPGEPLTVEVLAESLARRVLPALDEAARVTESTRAGIAAEWRGLFARRSQAAADELAAGAREAAGRVVAVVERLRAYAARLRAAQEGLAVVRADAAAAGLVVAGSVVSAPPGRECDLLPFLGRARALYRMAEPEHLDRDPEPPDALAVLMLAPGASAAVGQGVYDHRAAGLRALAGSRGGAPARGLTSAADDLEQRGRWLSRGTTAVTTPLGVVLDHEAGESWTQAGASQGAGVLAGGAAAAGTSAALTAWTGPGAIAVGALAFGAGVVAGAAANSAVDARFEASRRGPAAALAYRCGPGQRRRPPRPSKYGVR